MTPKEIAAMQQALEAVHNSANALLFLARDCEMRNSSVDDCNEAITALRKALAEPDWEAIGREQLRRYKEKFGDFEQAEQEPVGIYYGEAKGVGHIVRLDVELPVGTKLYTHPVRTKYLTDEEINEVLWRGGPFETVLDATRAVIAADREKNQ